MVDETALRNYLLKCELQYRADRVEGIDKLMWLAPYCNGVNETAKFLRSIGFHIKKIVDENTCDGEHHAWVITTSGVIVYATGDGLFGKLQDLSGDPLN